jgi:hypothetical protein
MVRRVQVSKGTYPGTDAAIWEQTNQSGAPNVCLHSE